MISYLVHHFNLFRRLPECVVAGSILCFLVLLAEIHLLSNLPLARPLDHLWLVHFVILAGLAMVVFRRHDFTFIECMSRCRDDIQRSCRALPWWFRAALALTVLHVSFFAGYGFFANSFDWDGLEYHLPMAVQPYQDGRLGELGSSLPWIDHYPRGMALLWYHSLQLTGSIALVPVFQCMGGCLLALCAASVGRRLGARRQDAMLCGIIIVAMPAFGLFSRSIYIDLPVAWAALAVVLFLSPPHGESPCSRRGAGLLFACLAFSVAMQMKLPIIPTIFLGFGLIYRLCFSGEDLRADLLYFVRSRFFLGAMIVLVIAAYPYWINLIRFGNPMFPVGFELPFGIHLEGPLKPEIFEHYGRSHFGSFAELGRFGRYPAAWLDLYQEANPDATGLTGAAFVFGILFLFVVFFLRSLQVRDGWHITVGLMCLSVLSLGSLALPRYQLPMAALAVAAAVTVLSGLVACKGRAYFRQGILIFCGFSAFFSIDSALQQFQWAKGVIGERFSLLDRLSVLPEVECFGSEWYASSEMISQIRKHSGSEMILAWNVQAFVTFLWNASFSNRLVHIPGSPADFYPGSPADLRSVPADQLEAWFSELLSLEPDHVLLYAHSDYARRMEAGGGDLFEVVFRDSDSRGKWAMVLFRYRPSASVPGA
ncbi:MAG: hypothetical protein JJU00_09025 [Opitutales bacterium]|nr:hypothetical protein [Opitutales bacterium]